MDTTRAIVIALHAAACALAVRHTRRDRGHAPVAWLLACLLVVDLARLGLTRLLEHAPRPRLGIWRVPFHLDQALMLGWYFAMTTATVRVFFGRGHQYVVAAGVATWAAIAALYPGLRGTPLLVAYRLVIQSNAVAMWVACAVAFVLASRRRAPPERRHLVMLLFAGSYVLDLGTNIRIPGRPEWRFVEVANVVLFALVALVQWPARLPGEPDRASQRGEVS